MESIEKLRNLRDEAASKMVDNTRWVCARCEEIADEIEAELSEKYMALPLDADGVPIRIWDVVQFVNREGGTGAPVEVCAVSDHYAYYGEGKHFYKASMCRHVKPRTVQDVLHDMLYEAADACADGSTKIEDCIAKYAAELRMVDE